MRTLRGVPPSKDPCALCGHEPHSRTIYDGIVRWLDGTFERVPRCVDHEACYRRVLAAGEEWVVLDGRMPRPVA